MNDKHDTAIICLVGMHGGYDMDAFRLAKLLSTEINVTLIFKKGAPSDLRYRDEAKKLGINFQTINCKTFFSPSIIYNARRIVKEYNIKNVIFFGASEMRSLYFSFIGLDINLIIRHGMKKTTPKKDPLHRLVYSNVNWHVTICKFLADNVKEIIPFGKNAKLKTIYSALRYLPDNLPNPTIRNMQPLRLLHVGRVAPDKGQIDAIKSCHVLYDNKIPFELHIVGEIFPPHKDQFINVLSNVPYKNSIIYHGFSENVPEFLRSSDIFIYPSGGEGLANSFIEALGYGLVCIAYNNTSFPELRELGFELFIANHHDLDDLDNKLLEAVTYLKEHKIPITSNVTLAKKLFDSKRELNEFLEILQ